MAKFAINASGAMLLASLVQVSESISGSVVPQAMFIRSPLSCFFFQTHYSPGLPSSLIKKSSEKWVINQFTPRLNGIFTWQKQSQNMETRRAYIMEDASYVIDARAKGGARLD